MKRKRSDKREQAIYDAVHETIMKLRIEAQQVGYFSASKLETKLAEVQHAAGMAAVAAYRNRSKSLPKGRRD